MCPRTRIVRGLEMSAERKAFADSKSSQCPSGVAERESVRKFGVFANLKCRRARSARKLKVFAISQCPPSAKCRRTPLGVRRIRSIRKLHPTTQSFRSDVPMPSNTQSSSRPHPRVDGVVENGLAPRSIYAIYLKEAQAPPKSSPPPFQSAPDLEVPRAFKWPPTCARAATCPFEDSRSQEPVV